jgi:hypothetical protein
MKIEYQVVHGDGDVETFPNLFEATYAFRLDDKATELRKVKWTYPNGKDEEPDREDITIQARA